MMPEAWKDAWDRALQGARQEARVVVYGPLEDIYKDAALSFQKSHPEIKVSYVGGPGRIVARAILSERKEHRFIPDLFIGGTGTILSVLLPEGACDPLKPVLIQPEVQDPAKWFGGKLSFADDGEKYVLKFAERVNDLIAVNTKIVDPNEFRSYWDLLHPKWKDKVAVMDPRKAGLGAGQARFLYVHPDLGRDFIFRFFSEAKPFLAIDPRQQLDFLAQGKYPIALLVSVGDVHQAGKSGLPVALVPSHQIKEGGPLSSGFTNVALMNKAPNPNAAKVYLNWLLSQIGQQSWTDITRSPSLRRDISFKSVHPVEVPKEGGQYLSISDEKYVKIIPKTFSKFIDEAMAQRRAT
jgi:iron(III) transport system substrate-binding protein